MVLPSRILLGTYRYMVLKRNQDYKFTDLEPVVDVDVDPGSDDHGLGEDQVLAAAVGAIHRQHEHGEHCKQ